MKDSAPISQELLQLKKESPTNSVGQRVTSFNDELDLQKPTIYLHCPISDFEKILVHLFAGADHFQSIQIVYLDNQSHPSLPSKVLENCIRLAHHTLIQVTEHLQKSLPPTLAAYENLEEPFNTIHITDGSQDFLSNFKQYGKNGSSMYATDYAEIGCQMHLMPKSRMERLDKDHFEYYRVGTIKSQRRDWEPLLRNHHICLFDANSLKKAELPSKQNDNPSGFSAEEAIQLIRYAMVSPKMSFVMIYNIASKKELDNTSAIWASQAIWYGIQGADNRAYEKPFNNENLVEFLIDTQILDYPLSFIKSKKTKRWWVKIPTRSSNYQEYLYLPCTESDYRQSRENQLPNRIVRAISRAQD